MIRKCHYFVDSNQRIIMKPKSILISLVFFGLAITVHGYPGTRDSSIGQASFNRIKRSGKVFDNLLAVKAAIINDALELKKKGLAFLEGVVIHFKAKVQMQWDNLLKVVLVVQTLVPSKGLLQ